MALRDGSVDAAICLGSVIRGETAHFDYVARARPTASKTWPYKPASSSVCSPTTTSINHAPAPAVSTATKAPKPPSPPSKWSR